MYYAPPGLCLNDFAVLPVEDGWRLLHLQAPPVEPFDAAVLETSYGSADSTDLVTWKPLGPTFGIGRPGAFDASAIWTMSHVELGSGTAMFYTGVSGRPRHRQAVGLAVSERRDGTGWRRVGTGPVAEPDPRWYRVDDDMAWRDPFVVHDPDGYGCWVMVVCARVPEGPAELSGCVGVATSDDLEHWTVHPPLLFPGDVDEFECPVLEPATGGGWHLLGSIGRTHTVHAWHAEQLTGTWRHLGPIAPPGPYAPRLTDGFGDRLLLHTLQRRVGLTDSGALARGVLAPPKLWRSPPSGAPDLQWWTGFEQHLDRPTDKPVHDGLTTLRLDQPERVRVLFGDESDRPLALTVTPDEAIIGYAGRTALQRTPLPTAAQSSLRIMRMGEFIEVYVDDRLTLSTLAYAAPGTSVTALVDERLTEPEFRAARPGDTQRDDRSSVATLYDAPRLPQPWA